MAHSYSPLSQYQQLNQRSTMNDYIPQKSLGCSYSPMPWLKINSYFSVSLSQPQQRFVWLFTGARTLNI